MHGTIPAHHAIGHARAGWPRAVGATSRLDEALIRGLDLSVSLVALIVVLPLMLAIAAAIWLTDPGPVFFAHRRIGRGGVTFPCLKFRSMAIDAQERLTRLLAQDPAARAEWERDFKLRNDPRITAIGVFLRKSSLDELPQLINVIRGEMSLVGPRPIVNAEVARYHRYIAHYCAVRPGITGLWQISGRNDTTYRRRVALDVAFARSRSPWLHLRVLSATIPCVLLARGSY